MSILSHPLFINLLLLFAVGYLWTFWVIASITLLPFLVVGWLLGLLEPRKVL